MLLLPATPLAPVSVSALSAAPTVLDAIDDDLIATFAYTDIRFSFKPDAGFLEVLARC